MRFFIIMCIVLIQVTNVAAKKRGMVAVYRWYDPVNKEFMTVAEHEYSKSEMASFGWTDKTLLFYAYKKQQPHTIAVYNWYNPVSRAHISVAADEFTDEQMQKNGYANKRLQFYALTRRAEKTVCVYRWLTPKRHAWVTIMDEDNTDALVKKGFRHKTYQYYGIVGK